MVIIQSTHCFHHVSRLNVILGFQAGDLVRTHLFWQSPSHHTPRLLLEWEALQVGIVVIVVLVVDIVVLVVFMISYVYFSILIRQLQFFSR